MNEQENSKFKKLRKKAEELLSQTPGIDQKDAFSNLLQELQIHQIELQVQNSELLETTRELEKSRDRFSFLYHHSPVGYASLDKNGIIKEANNRLAEITQQPLDSILFRPLSDLIYEEDKKIYFARFKAFIKKPENKLLETRLKKNKSFFHAKIEGRYIPWNDKTESDNNILITITDISQKKKLEEKLRMSNRMDTASTMAGGIAHEFNNILSVIIGNAELAMMYGQSKDQKDIHLNDILKTSMKAKNIVEKIMNISDFFFDNPARVNVLNSVSRTVNKISEHLPSGIKIGIVSNLDSAEIFADQRQLEFAVYSIIDNAVSFIENEKGKIEINISKQTIDESSLNSFRTNSGGYIKIDIADSGIGIPEEEIEKIFDPFYTTKEVGQGQGIGLSAANGIIRRNKGFIDVSSKKNQGSVFSIYLPEHK